MPKGLALSTLLAGHEARFWGPADQPIHGVSHDSRRIEPGDAFVAVPGFVHDGVQFAPAAVAAGAVAVVSERAAEAVPVDGLPRTWARVPDARRALASMACRFWAHPSRELTLAAVTGTNGKTTVTSLLEAMLGRRGPAGLWSTTAVRVAGDERPVERTTPEAPDLQRALRAMVDAGCWAAVLEVSSHALALHRVDGTRFDAAVFTNLSVDHLDFHHDMDRYLDAKALLFEALDDGAVAILNATDAASPHLAARTAARVVAYGWAPDTARAPSVRASPRGLLRPAARSPELAYRILSWERDGDLSRMALATPNGVVDLRSPLFGPANAENLAAAAATALELGCGVEAVVEAAAEFSGARGRFERVDVGQPFAVLVDYAHTPAALEAALAACRTLTPRGRLIVVFGCGGDRDRGKRPAMGRVASLEADHVLITSDNPRSEDPPSIIDAVRAGVPANAGAEVESEPDRRHAIERALGLAGAGDCVLIAGKGHETEQVFADRTVPFDDVQVAAECLAGRHATGHRRSGVQGEANDSGRTAGSGRAAGSGQPTGPRSAS